MNDQRPLFQPIPRHPLFRAMVLMGNGIAVGCGGTTVTERNDPGDGAGGGGGGSGGAGTTGAGGLTGAAGSGFNASGGSVNFVGSGGAFVIRGTGGTQPAASGGTTNDPSPPLPLPCPPAQYDCAAVNLQCDATGRGWSFDTTCKCNPQRPKSAADCTRAQSFVCLDGTTTASGAPLQTPLPFECSCVPASPDCGTACDTAFKHTRMSCNEAPAGGIVCGCAFVTLR